MNFHTHESLDFLTLFLNKKKNLKKIEQIGFKFCVNGYGTLI